MGGTGDERGRVREYEELSVSESARERQGTRGAERMRTKRVKGEHVIESERREESE